MVSPAESTRPASLAAYRLQARVLSPLHVGAGGPAYLRDLDYIVHELAPARAGAPPGARADLVDIDALLEALPEERLTALAGKPLGETLPIAERAAPDARLVSRRLPISDGNSPAEIRPFVRDAFGRAYLPGSSLKGAVRSALLWQHPPDVQVDRLNRNPSWSINDLENQHFAGAGAGTLQNRSLLRALHIADGYAEQEPGVIGAATGIFQPTGEAPSPTLTNRRPTFCLEAVQPNTVFYGSLTLDLTLLAGDRRLSFPQAEWLAIDALTAACRDRAAELLDFELDFYRDHGLQSLVQVYTNLQTFQQRLRPLQFLLPVGFGTGWQAKTLGRRLTPDQLVEIQRRYERQLALWLRNPAFPRLFPKTRKLMAGAGGRPTDPLGWLQITLTETRHA